MAIFQTIMRNHLLKNMLFLACFGSVSYVGAQSTGSTQVHCENVNGFSEFTFPIPKSYIEMGTKAGTIIWKSEVKTDAIQCKKVSSLGSEGVYINAFPWPYSQLSPNTNLEVITTFHSHGDKQLSSQRPGESIYIGTVTGNQFIKMGNIRYSIVVKTLKDHTQASTNSHTGYLNLFQLAGSKPVTTNHAPKEKNYFINLNNFNNIHFLPCQIEININPRVVQFGRVLLNGGTDLTTASGPIENFQVETRFPRGCQAAVNVKGVFEPAGPGRLSTDKKKIDMSNSLSLGLKYKNKLSPTYQDIEFNKEHELVDRAGQPSFASVTEITEYQAQLTKTFSFRKPKLGDFSETLRLRIDYQ